MLSKQESDELNKKKAEEEENKKKAAMAWLQNTFGQDLKRFSLAEFNKAKIPKDIEGQVREIVEQSTKKQKQVN